MVEVQSNFEEKENDQLIYDFVPFDSDIGDFQVIDLTTDIIEKKEKASMIMWFCNIL